MCRSKVMTLQMETLTDRERKRERERERFRDVPDLIFVNSIVRMYRNDVVLWEFETARRRLWESAQL